MLRSLALIAFLVSVFTDVATGDDAFWGRLAELAKTKGIAVNFKRVGETFGLPSSSNAYPSYQVYYDENDGRSHHLTVYEDASKAVHLIVTSFERESKASRLGHAYLILPNGELRAAAEGLNFYGSSHISGHWLWAQVETSRVTAAFESEVSYWGKKAGQLATKADRPATGDWKQRCENGSCRWWNGREKKWAE